MEKINVFSIHLLRESVMVHLWARIWGKSFGIFMFKINNEATSDLSQLYFIESVKYFDFLVGGTEF